MIHSEKDKEYVWFNEDSKTFLSRDYIKPNQSLDGRANEIAYALERTLGKRGYAEKFLDYFKRGWFSLSTPIWVNFGTDRALPISCVTGDTWISTEYDGAKLASDIRIGDSVLTHEGRYRKITDVMKTENRSNIYSLNVINRKTETFITENHQVLTDRGWVRVDELNVENDKIACVGKLNPSNEEYDIDVTKFVPYEYSVVDGLIKKKSVSLSRNKKEFVSYYSSPSSNVKFTEELAWAFGVWFAEGSLSIDKNKLPNGIRATFNVNDKDIAERWLRVISSHFNINGNMYTSVVNRNGKENSWISVNVNSKIIGEFFKSFGSGCKNKTIPDFVMKSSYEHLHNFYEAFAKQDGTKRKNGYRILLSNPRLVTQLFQIASILGANTSLQMKRKAAKLSTTPYIYELSSTYDYSNSNSIVYNKIASLYLTNKTETVYDFTVEEDHSFVANGMIVHNCFGSVIGDSIQSIMDTASEIAVMTKIGGGTSATFDAIRGLGSDISTGDKAGGPMNFLPIFETVQNTISQGATRRGAFASYLSVAHPDILEYLNIRDEGNALQDINFGVTIPRGWIASMRAGDRQKQEVWAKVLKSRANKGYPYLIFLDNMNDGAPDVYQDKKMLISHSNLCVHGDTTILTNEGHVKISDYVNREVSVWNGSEWSDVIVRKTGENQNLIRVSLSNGRSIECTPYHKFYLNNSVEPIQANELKVGDKLCRSQFPVIEGSIENEFAYTNGFFTGDGCRHKNSNIIYLYGEKESLKNRIEYDGSWNDIHDYTGKKVGVRANNVKNLDEKYTVPDAKYTVRHRLNWLAGLLDSDGTVSRNGANQSLQISSIHKDFLLEVADMLQTLGVDAKLNNSRLEGYRNLPDGKGGTKSYNCKSMFRILIASLDTQKLLDLGLNLSRLSVEKHSPNRNSRHFVRVTRVDTVDGLHDTYCFNEPLRNRGVFNGVLTGQCVEIALPNSHDESFVCDLSSMNVAFYDDWKDTDAVEVLTYALDAVMTEFIEKARNIKHMERAVKFAVRHRAIGIGWIGWHTALQKKMIAWESEEAIAFNKKVAKTIKTQAYAASRKLAIEYGEPEVLKGYGRRNTTLLAIAPTKSSAFILGQVSEGIEPMRSNYYISDLAKGKFIRKNRNLEELLESKGLNTSEVWDDIMEHNGSVAHMTDTLTDHERNVFKTFKEISPSYIILHAASRQPFIDQSQSLNLIIDPKMPVKDVNSLILDGYDMGIKSFYYQFNQSAAQELRRELTSCASCEA